MPLLAVASGLAAATLTSLPLTVGFFADEFFFAAARERGPLLTIPAVAFAATTLAYTWRFWSGIFIGEVHAAAHRVPRLLVVPVVALGAIGLVGASLQAHSRGWARRPARSLSGPRRRWTLRTTTRSSLSTSWRWRPMLLARR
jgi:multicomponent Na+:H+ antiporter subunit A